MSQPLARARRAVLLAGLALAGAAGADAARAQGAAPPEQQRRLIEQKLRLVETLANSPAAKSSAYGRDAETPALVASVQQLLDKARAALAGERLDEAAAALDEALRAAAKASKRSAGEGAGLSESAQRQTVRELTEQVATYRGSLVELTRDATLAGAAHEALAKVDQASESAARAAAAGRHGDAAKLLAEAYRVAVAAVSQLRAGQTVTLALKFDTPADEYAYEIKRNHSHEILVDMMISEGRAEGQKRALVDRFVAENKRLALQAEKEARAGDYKAAITTMEQATGALVRALQSVGMPVF